MTRQPKSCLKLSAWFAAAGCLLASPFQTSAQEINGARPLPSSATPNVIAQEDASATRPKAITANFQSRNLADGIQNVAYPSPIAHHLNPQAACQAQACLQPFQSPTQGWYPRAGRDEYVFDGSDRGEPVHVDQAWNIHGLQTEDTVGYFDTLDGRRIVQPSNRVAIYAPRFGAVRKLDGIINANHQMPVVALEEQTPIVLAEGHNISSTTKQHLALNRMNGAKRASGFVDRTRGVVADNTIHLHGLRNTFQSYENLSLLRTGKYSNAEAARLDLGIQSALVWEDDLGLEVVAQNVAPIVVRDIKTAEALVHVESKDGDAILRVTKVASKIAAKTGEYVEFTIRYDNLSDKKIGNVTIIDNLTRRLEFVPGSAESSLEADFISEQNDGGSLMLRWEIKEPVDAKSGGLVRFQCRVR